MSSWDEYPATYRQSEVTAICSALRAGECVSLLGLSGAGKSNLAGFICGRVSGEGLPGFLLVDCNRLAGTEPGALFSLLAETLGEEDPSRTSSLRALRDRFKYRLTYLCVTRRPLPATSELAELFYAHTLWLGPLSAADARWSASSYAARRGAVWSEGILSRLIELSWGYPALLRAACEAFANGAELEVQALRAHPAVRRRAAEFWADRPTPEEIRLCGLEGQPLLADEAPLEVDPASLTAAEQRLLDYLRTHPGRVCLKDELVGAVWPDETAVAGIRDESLAQLVHRLRDKIGSRFVQTVAGRGYRYQP